MCVCLRAGARGRGGALSSPCHKARALTLRSDADAVDRINDNIQKALPEIQRGEVCPVASRMPDLESAGIIGVSSWNVMSMIPTQPT